MTVKYHLNSKNKYAVCGATKRKCRFARSSSHITQKEYSSLNSTEIPTVKEKMEQLEQWGIDTGTAGLASILPAPKTVRRGINTPDNPILKKLDADADKLKEAGLAKEEKDTLTSYTFMSNRYVNAYLWGGEKGVESYSRKYAPREYSEEELKSYLEKEIPHVTQNALSKIEKLDAAFNKIPQTKTPKVLYRGFYLPKDYEGDVASYIEANFKEGSAYTPKSYLSTSADSDLMLAMSAKQPKRFFVIEIATKTDGIALHRKQKGERATSIQESEREVLLPRDMKFKVHSVTNATYETTYENKRPGGFFFESRIPQKKRFNVIQIVEQ